LRCVIRGPAICHPPICELLALSGTASEHRHPCEDSLPHDFKPFSALIFQTMGSRQDPVKLALLLHNYQMCPQEAAHTTPLSQSPPVHAGGLFSFLRSTVDSLALHRSLRRIHHRTHRRRPRTPPRTPPRTRHRSHRTRHRSHRTRHRSHRPLRRTPRCTQPLSLRPLPRSAALLSLRPRPRLTIKIGNGYLLRASGS
jgi:hypothetical protein